MSLERVLKTLVNLGLSRSDAEVYVYIAKKGPQTVVNLAKALTTNKQKIDTSLRNLQIKGLVKKDRSVFSALSFEKALNLLIERQKEEEMSLKEVKQELFDTWKRNS